MKTFGFSFFIFLRSLASAQEKKKDSADISKEIFEYKPRIFYPVDCSCPDRVIYKEAKPNDKNFNPYQYKEIKVIKIEDFSEEEKKKFFAFLISLFLLVKTDKK